MFFYEKNVFYIYIYMYFIILYYTFYYKYIKYICGYRYLFFLKITHTFVKGVLTLLIYRVYTYSENLIIFDVLQIVIWRYKTIDNGIIISQTTNYFYRYGHGLNGSRLHCPFVMHVLFVCEVQLRELMISMSSKERKKSFKRRKSKK